MIIELLRRFRMKLKRGWFKALYAPRLMACGRHSYLHAPFRIDGPQFIRLGENSVVQSGGWLYCNPVDGLPARMTIGSGCVLGYNNHITAVRDVIIEDRVLTANNVHISDNLHEYEDIHVPIMDQRIRFKGKVVIGQGSWIGENATIIGASIGRNCVVGANSVVTRDVPDYSVVVGAPAKVVRQFDLSANKWVDKNSI